MSFADESGVDAGGLRKEMFTVFFRALFSHLANKLLVVREACCVAQGHPRCSFVVASLTRKVELESALAKADGDVPKALQLLAEVRA